MNKKQSFNELTNKLYYKRKKSSDFLLTGSPFGEKSKK